MRTAFLPVFALALVMLAGCGGGSSSSGSNSSGSGSGSGSGSSGSGGSTVSNNVAVQVNPGPANNDVNGLFVSVTICEPGTSTCQTIPNITVDTGSMGLRLLSSEVSLSLPSVTASGNALQECVSFADGSYVWGPVVTADIQMAGEKASSVPVQIISAAPSHAAPSGCAGSGTDDNTVESLGANGILGIGNFRQDCGSACTSSTSLPQMYYLCSGSGCETTAVSLTSQLQNPVWVFPQDNNGVLISLPSIPATGAASVSGSLIFGIGTQSDNALGSAKVYTTDASGNFITTFKNVAYNQSYLDTGSNGLFFLDASTLGIADCPDNKSFYCPPSTVQYTATTAGLNGTSAQISFSVANADSLFNTNNSAFSDLAGPSPRVFDWGLPFFFGRSVFVGIEGQASPAGVGPYWAY